MEVSIRPHLAAIVGLALAATVPAITKAQTAAAPTPDIAATIKAVMDDQYGQTYDAKHSCWANSYSGGETDAADYCMRPGKHFLRAVFRQKRACCMKKYLRHEHSNLRRSAGQRLQYLIPIAAPTDNPNLFC